jgi:hypothetical protein
MEKEKKITFLFIFIFITFISISLADEWDSLIEEDVETINNISEDSSSKNPEPSQPYYKPEETSPKGETKFTQDFYIALALLVVAAIIIAYFAYSFFKKPKNKWEK